MALTADRAFTSNAKQSQRLRLFGINLPYGFGHDVKTLFWIKAFLLAWALSNLLGSTEAPGHFLFKSYGSSQGLKTSPYCMTHDKAGFLWVGTENGLFRYEEGHFRNKRPGLWIQRVLPALDGGVWINAEGNIAHFKDEKLKPIRNPIAPELNFDGSFDLDPEGRLWVHDRNHGELLREKKDGSFEKVGDAQGLQSVRHSLNIGASTGTPRLIVSKRLCVWQKNQLVPLQLPLREEPDLAAEDGTGCLWVASASKLLRWPLGAAAPEDATHLLPGPYFVDGFLHTDPDGWLWIPTHQGTLAVKGDQTKYIGPRQGLPIQYVTLAMPDKEGNLWIMGNTLVRLLGGTHVETHHEQSGFSGSLTWAIHRDRQNRLWAGTHQGLLRLDERGWTKIPSPTGVVVRNISEDPKGTIWVAYRGAPLCRVSPGGAVAEPVTLRPSPTFPSENLKRLQKAPVARSLLCDQKGILWIMMPFIGLCRVDPQTLTILEKVNPLGQDSASDPFSTSRVLEDPKGRIWLSSSPNGLFCLSEGKWLNRQHGLLDTSILGMSLSNNPDEIIICYNKPSGISRIGVEGNQLNIKGHIQEKDGLASNLVLATTLGPKGEVWVSTDQGLDRIGVNGFQHFTEDRGLPSEDCVESALWPDPNGDIWVGTSKGLAHMVASREPRPLPPPKTWLLQVQRGEKWLLPPFEPGAKIVHKEGTLEFRFDSPSYSAESSMEFQVRLEGLEPAWRNLQERASRYTALAPGRYLFEVRARRKGEPWGPPTSYAFQILTPWWRSWWMITLEIAGLYGCISTYIKARLKRMSRDKARLEALLVSHTRDLHISNHALQDANRALENMSLMDKLTSLYNRRYFGMIIQDECAKARRVYRDASSSIALPNQDLIIFLINLDHFSQINTQFGHGTGDEVIRKSAQAIKTSARETDVVVRMDGETFVLLARAASRKDAPLIAERIRATIAQQTVLQDKTKIQWTCSVGFTALPFHPAHLDWMNWEKALELADTCLGHAKSAGRNTWLGVQAKAELDPEIHEQHLPWEIDRLGKEGVLEIQSNHPEPFGSKKKRI